MCTEAFVSVPLAIDLSRFSALLDCGDTSRLQRLKEKARAAIPGTEGVAVRRGALDAGKGRGRAARWALPAVCHSDDGWN